MTPQDSSTSSEVQSASSVTDYSDKAEFPQSEECAPNGTVSIVGMGCRWPGGVTSPSHLWDLLAKGKSGYQEFNDSKFNISGYYHPNSQRPGSTPARGAYLLQEDPRLFDHTFFGITPTETLTLDPQHRKLLEVVYEAFENAGEPWEKFYGSRTGVFVGNFTADHNLMQTRDTDNLLPYGTTGASTSILSNRINYTFNLHGPSLTLDTACSSSLYALHLAVNAIKNGDCDSAIVGAGNLILNPDLHLSLSKLGALSPSATCHVFDAAADGYARGEGFAAFYLKRTSDAIAGSYPIRAVIRGTAINSNGRTAGITHPSAEGQVKVIREAYANAKLDPSLTGYFEAHGTGTQVGDPTEVDAIGQVFAQSSQSSELRIGSIKSNIGHTEAASGMAGLMKCVLAMEHGYIPPTIGITKLNPNIDFERARVRPVTQLEPWPLDRLKRVSINSFGYGGANGHCILDDVSVALPWYTREDTQVVCEEGVHTRHRRMVVLPFSAKDGNSLKENIRSVSNAMRNHRLGNLAYTLSARRSRFKHRTYRIVEAGQLKSAGDVEATTPSKPVSGRKPNIGLVFTGQGAQWEGMGADLLEYSVFRKSIMAQDSVLSSLSNAPSWSIHGILSGTLKGRLHEPMITQTVCTALQVAIVDLLRSWKMDWTASVGHSSGEIAAAYAAGLITSTEAIIIAYCRGIAVSENKRSGLMLAVGLGKDQVEPYLDNFKYNVRVAAINSSESVTLSGDTSSVMETYEALLVKGVFARILQTGRNAYHSHHMISIGERYIDLLTNALSEVNVKYGDCSNKWKQTPQWFSSAIPDQSQDSITLDPMYWRRNLQAPVNFLSAVENMMTSPTAAVDVLIEVGPHCALKSPLRQILTRVNKEFTYFSALRRHEDGMRNILSLCGDLFCIDAQIDLVIANSSNSIDDDDSLGPQMGSMCIDLPKYAYSYGPVIYHENRLSKESRLRKHLKHDILGSKRVGGSNLRPSWRNVLHVKHVPWLLHHKLGEQTIFPASGYICMALEAARQFIGDEGRNSFVHGFTIRNLSFKAAMIIPENDVGVEVVLDLDASKAVQTRDRLSWYCFKISSVVAGNWTEHCSGIVKPNTERISSASMSSAMNHRVISAAKWYKKFHELGLEYGDSFQGLSDLTSDPLQNKAQGKVALQTTAGMFNGPESSYIIHPASLDICVQLALVAAHGGQTEQMSTAYIPSFVGELNIWASTTATGDFGTATAHGERHGLRGAHAQTQLINASGEMMLKISDMQCTKFFRSSEHETTIQTLGSPYMRLVWKPHLKNMSSEQALSLFPPMKMSEELVNKIVDIDRMSALMVAEIAEQFSYRMNENNLPEHFYKFLAWAERKAHSTTISAQEALAMSSPDRASLINDLYTKLQDVVEVPISRRIFENMDGILSGTKTSLELVRQDDSHSQMYNSGLGMSASYTQLERVVDLLAHANPSMNIIEIGAGTGGATRVALKTLSGNSNLRRYQRYDFTDVSSGYFLDARTEFSEFHGLEFGVLDIEEAPASQGFEPIYDLVIASCSIHITKDIQHTLSNARSLLKPDGKLLILEVTQPNITHGLVLGTFPDYWVGTEEARMDSPFLPASEWRRMISATGFSGVELELDDYLQPHTMISTFLTSAVEVDLDRVNLYNPAPTEPGYIVSLLGPTLAESTKCFITNHCGALAFSWHGLGGNLPDTSRVIILSDVNSSLMHNEEQFQGIKKLLSDSISVVWINVTDNSEISYPYAAITNGLLRVLGAENPSATYISVGVRVQDLSNRTLMQQILSLGNETPVDLEYEVINGALHISRMIADEKFNESFSQPKNAKTQMLPLHNQLPLAAAFATPGILSSLYFEEDTLFWTPLQDDYVEIRTKAVGLNWKDLAVSAGRLNLDNFSSECSGIVTKVGKAVKDFQIGDKVFGISKGKFGNYMRSHHSLVQHMHGENFAEMAAVPITYMTALYALDSLARLEDGEKVLIQSASGGLGIAALNVARQRGADIWATVGSEEKRAFLINEYSIPDAQILSSKTHPGVEAVNRATGGCGFDVILSTGSGDSLSEWLRCLAPAGRFIDVGRVDVQDHASMHMEIFKRNVTFSSFDLGILIEDKPALCGKLLAKASEMIRNSSLPQIAPIKTFDISQLATALLQFSKGVHIGKIVITYEEQSSLISAMPPKFAARFDAQAIYILVGGLGGLGRSIISWMITRGARNFAVLSRSSPDQQMTSSFIFNVVAQGCNVEHICCDVTQLSEVEIAIAQAGRNGVIKGIIHTAVMLQDKLFNSLSFSEWQRGLTVKVDGTINLHKASLHHPLEFFVLVSSIVAQIALPTQSTYCASNNFQNDFARFRRNMGLPATAVELGLIDEAGELGQNPVYQNAALRNGLYGSSEYEFIQRLDHIFADIHQDGKVPDWKRYDPSADGHLITSLDPAQLLLQAKPHRETSSSDTSSLPRWHSDARFAHSVQAMKNLDALDATHSTKLNASSDSNKDIQAALSDIDALITAKDIDIATVQVTKSIIARMADMLFIPAEGIDSSKGIAAYGMDSLIAAELRNWFVTAYKCTISFLQLLDTATSIQMLAGIVIKSRMEKL